jgi:hypothetical protein
MAFTIHQNQIDANGIDFSLLECGQGSLALCIHGFPDSAHTWRYLLPALAQAGFRAVAPLRGATLQARLPRITAVNEVLLRLMSMLCTKSLEVTAMQCSLVMTGVRLWLSLQVRAPSRQTPPRRRSS